MVSRVSTISRWGRSTRTKSACAICPSPWAKSDGQSIGPILHEPIINRVDGPLHRIARQGTFQAATDALRVHGAGLRFAVACGRSHVLFSQGCAGFSEAFKLQARNVPQGLGEHVGAVIIDARAVVNIGAENKLPLPSRPIVDFHPRVEFLGIRAGNRVPLAATQPVTIAVSLETAERQRAVLEPEVHQAGRQPLEDPREIDFDRRIGMSQRAAERRRATAARRCRSPG